MASKQRPSQTAARTRGLRCAAMAAGTAARGSGQAAMPPPSASAAEKCWYPMARSGETKEQMGGFDIIECASLDEAVEIAARHPAAASGAIEVRPLWQE
jgi:YCII-related domain